MSEGINNQNISQKNSASPMLAKVFLWVLAGHVVVIVCFGAYHLLKGGEKKMTQDTVVQENASEFKGEETAEQQATVQTEQNAAGQTVTETARSAPETGGMSMPSTSDPIWNSPVQMPRVPQQKMAVNQGSSSRTGKVMTSTAETGRSGDAGSHTVAKGDSLYKIAKTHGVTVAALKSANKLNSDNLKIGQTLCIPGGTEPAAAAPAATTETSEKVAHAAVMNSKPGFKNYKVAQGDTLWKIAKNFKAKPEEIARMNNMSDPAKLKIGSTIKVPSSGARETASPVVQPAHTVLQNTDVAMVPAKKD